MNLNDSISFYAGGPGSGCQGENCGRPAGESNEKEYGKWKDEGDGISSRKVFKPGPEHGLYGTGQENVRQYMYNGKIIAVSYSKYEIDREHKVATGYSKAHYIKYAHDAGLSGKLQQTGGKTPADNVQRIKNALKINSLEAGVEDVEMEGKPVQPVQGTKRIIKKGTQFCVVSDGVDKNFGCWPSREQAQAVAAGKSFIEPLMKAAKWQHPSAHQKHGDITHASYIDSRWGIDHETGLVYPPRDPFVEKERKYHRKKIEKASKKFVGGVVDAAAVKAGTGAVTRTGWQYSKRATSPGFIPLKTLSGFPTSGGGKKPGGKMGHQLTSPSMHKGVGRNHRLPNPSFEAGGPGSGRKPGWGSGTKNKEKLEAFHKILVSRGFEYAHSGGKPTSDKGRGHTYVNKDKKEQKTFIEYANGNHTRWSSYRIRSYADMGEPMAGALQHAHLDTNLWFHPPSLKNPQRIPTDDPREKNNRFGDVTKRKEAHKDRMKLLKRSSPGGNPPLIPARTTMIQPHQAVYTPGMFSSWQGRRRRRAGGGMFRSFGAAKI